MKRSILLFFSLLISYSNTSISVNAIDFNDALDKLHNLDNMENYSFSFITQETSFRGFSINNYVKLEKAYVNGNEFLDLKYQGTDSYAFEDYNYTNKVEDSYYSYDPNVIYHNEDGSTYESFAVNKINYSGFKPFKFFENISYEVMEFDENTNSYHFYNDYTNKQIKPTNGLMVPDDVIFTISDNYISHIEINVFYYVNVSSEITYGSSKYIIDIFDVGNTVVPIAQDVSEKFYDAIENNTYIDTTKGNGQDDII